jgi:hypothetical protein
MLTPWGSGVWGKGAWGEGNQDATVTFTAWGQSSWGSGPWGLGNVTTALSTNINSVVIAIDNEIFLTGEQLTCLYPNFKTSTVQNVSGTSDNILFTFRSGGASNIQYVGVGWNVVGQPTFIVTAVNLDPNDQYTGTITITGGTFVSGGFYAFESPNVNVTADSDLTLSTNLLQVSLGDEEASGSAIISLTTLDQLNTTIGPYEITADGNTSEIVVGDSMNSTVNSVTADAGAIIDLVGEQLNTALGDESITGDGSITLTTNELNTTTGTATGDVPSVYLIGSSVDTTTGTVSFTIDGSVILTGVNMTTSTGRAYITAWAVVDIGVTNTWGVVDIAA